MNYIFKKGNTKIILKKQQFLTLYGLFFCLSILSLVGWLTGVVGFIVMLGLFYFQTNYVRIILQKYGFQNADSLSWIYLLVCYIVSLTVIYYIFGLTMLSLLIWLAISSLVLVKFGNNNKNVTFSLLLFKKDIKEIITQPSLIIIAALSVYLITIFFTNPILNGSPTPWFGVSAVNFIVFLLITFLIIRSIIKQQNNVVITVLYLFLILGVVSAKYILSFGYDTLLHQAALQHIAQYGRITPLTPFYIGQYVLEILIFFFTRWTFILIERWFLPIFFIISVLAISKYFLKNFGLDMKLTVTPAVILIMLPNQFFYSSPYAFSLMWGLVAMSALYLFIVNGNQSDYYLAAIATIAAVFIHPFIGFSIAVAVVFALFFNKSNNKIKKIFILILTFLASSLIVVLSFGLFSWLKNNVLILADPIYYINNFLNLFNDPIWYIKIVYPWWLGLIYFYEKFHFVLITFIILFYVIIDKRKFNNIFLLVVGLGSLASAWLFMSGMEVSGYTYGDQVNYSYRLLQAAKWLLWPLILLAVVKFFELINKKNKPLQTVCALALSLLLTASWYLTYPRNDAISHINVNNVREVDYRAVDFIYKNEGGKNGYLVFANQIFGAAAIQRYGFGPYYDSPWGEVFYYSVPMGSELNKRYEKIMNLQEFDSNIICEALNKIGLNRSYLVITDYWPLAENVEKQIKERANGYWNIDNQIDIYLFQSNSCDF